MMTRKICIPGAGFSVHVQRRLMTMLCANCGATLNPNSRFCDQCGAARDLEETRIARQTSSTPARYDDDDVENVIFSARPTMLFIKIGYGTAIVGAILLVILL